MSSPVFGIIGLGVMGQNLALNIEEHGFPVAVWNLETDWTEKFIATNEGKSFTGTKSLEELVRVLPRPRRILVMIKAGAPVDSTLAKLSSILEEGDIVIDGGNSWFRDTQRRVAETAGKGFHFVGCGVSGGEEGARFGPSLMPGGTAESYEALEPVLEAIAAKTDSGACVTHVGPDGAGHFVKMVHNGVEYGDMQLIAEAYEVLRVSGGMDASELAAVFEEWNHGPLESFLIEITAEIFRVREGDVPLVDLVLDKAGQKGTGKWTAQVALDLAVPIPTIAAAIDARVVSSMKEQRVSASKVLAGPETAGADRIDAKALVADVQDALLASKICAYAQGMSLIRAGSEAEKWNIDLREMARIWKGGCIIRARLLDTIMQAFERNPSLQNLMIDETFAAMIAKAGAGWRRTVSSAQLAGIATPAFAASLAYFDSYRAARLPQNLTQAQRDLFGAHGYERVDAPGTPVHSHWSTVKK